MLGTRVPWSPSPGQKQSQQAGAARARGISGPLFLWHWAMRLNALPLSIGVAFLVAYTGIFSFLLSSFTPMGVLTALQASNVPAIVIGKVSNPTGRLAHLGATPGIAGGALRGT